MMEAKQSRSQDSQSELDVLCSESDSDGPHNTPKRLKRKKHAMHSSKRVRLGKEQKYTSATWKQQCTALLDSIFQWGDFTPFRYPVNLNKYPDYRNIIDCPMDLSTVREKLSNNHYSSPIDFCKDMRLIFQNSRNYNTNKKSRIYSMTIRLSAMFEEHIRSIVSDWRSAVKYEEKIRNNQYVSNRSETCNDPMVIYHEMMEAKQSRSQDSQSELDVLCSESDSDGPHNTPKRLKRKKHAMHSSKRVRLGKEQKYTSATWKQQCTALLDSIFQWGDSTPFRYPVNLNKYPDYRNIIDCPMDLSTVREKLSNNHYSSPIDFCKDMRLIFQNSRNYNTNKKSRIYSMTIRLSAMFEEHIRSIVSDWRSAVKYEEKIRNNQYVSNRSETCNDPMVIYHEMMEAKQSRSQDSQSELDVLCSESDSDGPHNTPKRLKRKKHAMHSSKRVRLGKEQKYTSATWKQQCTALLDSIFQWGDSTPFRYPVNLNKYPDYRNIIDCPMDLSTVREKLSNNHYSSPIDFCKDMRLIFQNSRNYNTNKKSRIYSMTIRLSAMFEEHIRSIVSDWRSAVKYEEKIRNNQYVSNRRRPIPVQETGVNVGASTSRGFPTVIPALPSTSRGENSRHTVNKVLNAAFNDSPKNSSSNRLSNSTVFMETKVQFAATDHAKVYRLYRRDTPVSLIEKVIACLKEKYDGPLDLAVDVGCGSGQSTVSLAPFFKKVHGIDVAEAQIQEAKSNRALPNITYETAPAEIIPFNDGTVQLISAGAALHWFQLDTFFLEVRRALCNNGILVVYCYFTLKPLLENSALTEEVDKLWGEMHSMTANYHAPQAKIAFDLYKSVTFPFEEIVKFDKVREVFDGELQDIIGYFSSFSGFQNWKRKEEKKASEFLAYVEKRFREIIRASTLDPDKPLKLYRDFFLIVCRKVEKES